MHGAILHSLETFTVESCGKSAWSDIVAATGIAGSHFSPTLSYPDADTLFILQGLVARTGRPAADILEAFGEYLAPRLLDMYGGLLDPLWRTLEVLENTEGTIHRVVRTRNRGAAPPALRVTRSSAGAVTIFYDSPRRMCHLALGIVRGIAAHFGERVSLDQPACMHSGADHCEIVVTIETSPK